MNDRIPTDVIDVLREHVESYEQLEVLLLLGRSHKREWSVDDVAGQLHLAAAAGSEVLEYLCGAGLLTRCQDPRGDRFRWHPDSSTVLDRLSQAYRDDRVGLMSLMTKNALDRVRTAALRSFARAFLLGRKHDG